MEFFPEIRLDKTAKNIYSNIFSSLEKRREAMIKYKTEPTEANTYLFSVGKNVLLF
jgi:hypothetical protein